MWNRLSQVMRLLLLLLLVAIGALSQNLNIGGPCQCDECLLLDGELHTLSNSTTNMANKCEENGCLMMKETDQTETCICHGQVSVAHTWQTDYDECLRELKPKGVFMSSTWQPHLGSNCIDGNTTAGAAICHTQLESEPWIKLDMGQEVNVTEVIIYDDDCTESRECPSRLENVEIWVGGDMLGRFIGPGDPTESHKVRGTMTLKSQYVDVRMLGNGTKGYLHLQEIVVFGPWV